MSRRWFGTDGIRTRAGEPPLVPAFLQRLGRALGEFSAAQSPVGRSAAGAGAAHDGRLVLIARDTRESGPAIVESLCTGLLATGARVLDLGVLPTAGLPVAMRARGAALGIVVSASHNPWTDNGIKIFGAGGRKLSDEVEERLEAAVIALGGTATLTTAGGGATGGGAPAGAAAGASRGTGGPSRAAVGAAAGAVERHDGAADYRSWLLSRFAELDLSGFSLAIDCANGAASSTAAAVLAGLGARVTSLFDAPDGRNINAGCGSTHLQPLAAHLRVGREDFGLAFDGDADRVLGVDRAGRTCDGDHMLGFLGPWLARRGELPGGVVVASVMSNLGLQKLLEERGVTMLRCPVGDRHVLHALREGGYGLGGEAAGHLLFREGEHWIGDGLFTALRLLAAMRDTGATLAQLIDEVPRVPQVLLNVPVASRPPVEGLSRLQARVSEEQARHGADLRILLRYSGTENLARVMVEGVDGSLVDRLAAELAGLWTAEIAALRGARPRPMSAGSRPAGANSDGPALALEASTLAVGVALVGPGGEPWGCVSAAPDARGTALLASAAAELLAARSLRVSDLLGVIVGTGPGSYTGTRAAIALARALVYAAGVRLVGVPSVAGAALGELRRRPDVRRVIVLIDARRGEAYRADYERTPPGVVSPLGAVRELLAPCLVTGADALPEPPPEPLPDAGGVASPEGARGASGVAPLSIVLADPGISVLREPHPDAYDVAAVGRERLLSGGDSPEAVLPLYLKRSHAEIVFDERVGSQGLGGG